MRTKTYRQFYRQLALSTGTINDLQGREAPLSSPISDVGSTPSLATIHSKALA